MIKDKVNNYLKYNTIKFLRTNLIYNEEIYNYRN